MIWSHNSLWDKAKLFVTRAQEHQRIPGLFAFWSLLAFELLARATLAKVHPALLAEPMDGGENLMYAFGLGKVKSPKSVAAATVFRRCQKVITGMTDDDVKACLALTNYRNEELHSGSPVLDALPPQSWLTDYYRLAEMMLTSQGKTLSDFFGPEEAQVAQQMISASGRDLESESKQTVADAQRSYDALTSQQRDEATARAEEAAAKWISSRGQIVECPACKNKAVLLGQLIRMSEPRIEGEAIAYDQTMMPARLDCPACGLALPDLAHLHPLNLGAPFTITEHVDPIEFYNIEPEYEPEQPDYDEYGND
jgi:hypothetical protein